MRRVCGLGVGCFGMYGMNSWRLGGVGGSRVVVRVVVRVRDSIFLSSYVEGEGGVVFRSAFWWWGGRLLRWRWRWWWDIPVVGR